MAKDGSVAPKERVNIVYKPATGDMQEQVELPFKSLVLGDFTLEKDDTPLEDREPINVDKDNFNEVLAGQNVKLEASVHDELTEGAEEDDVIPVNLKFESIKDFDPDQIIQQVPQLKNLHDLREALKALKGPMGNIPQFRKKIQELVADSEARETLLAELQLDEGEADAE
jgi:type VI secretion system protein ImpB